MKEFSIDDDAKTVTHNRTGLTFRFEIQADGSWLGLATDESMQVMSRSETNYATIARLTGDAWLDHVTRHPPQPS